MMSKAIQSISALGCAVLLLQTLAVSGGYTAGSYNDGRTTPYTAPTWMSLLPDNTPLNKVSFPGTQNSLQFYGGDAFRTQSMRLGQQLIAGIRAFDIRIRQTATGLVIDRAGGLRMSSEEGLYENLRAIRDFLEDYPSEAILLSCWLTDIKGKESSFQAQFDLEMRVFESFMYTIPSSELTVGDVRGKIVFFDWDGKRVIPSMIPKGAYIESANTRVTDNWVFYSNWDLHARWVAIKMHLIEATLRLTDKDETKYYGVSLAGGKFSMPYFVAGGKSSPGNMAPHLLTGRIPSTRGDYTDFPVYASSIAFEGLNYLAMDFLRAHNDKQTVGIVMSNFPGPSLIDTIVKLNPTKEGMSYPEWSSATTIGSMQLVLSIILALQFTA